MSATTVVFSLVNGLLVIMGPHAIHIIEDKQHVYLYGFVYSEEDKASATHGVSVVPGVADVKNYLRVVPKPDSQ